MIKIDNKLLKLADTLVNYSLKVEEGEKVLITVPSLECLELVRYLIDLIYNAKGIPNVRMMNKSLEAQLLERMNEKTVELLLKQKEFDVVNYDAFINIRYALNDYEEQIVNKEMNDLLGIKSKDYDEIRINERKWVLLNYPSYLDAYKAKMNYQEYYNYALETMTVNYEEMARNLRPLKELMEKTDIVRIVAPGTDLSFSIKGMPAVICAGEANIPDGEVFTAPIKDSVNGYITYNTPSPYKGNIYNKIRFDLAKGKIIKATCDNDPDKLNEILDTDEGSRYIGEFSLGVNNKIKEPMGDILYDEKICGSLHFTPGRAYKSADNGNKSVIHWDLVLIQREDFGGGEIYFDNRLIRKNGLFEVDELAKLNFK